MDEPEENDLEMVEKYDDFLDGKIQMTPYYELEKRGCAPVPIEGMSDSDVTRELTNLVWNLADLSIYIDSTDHLADRELYTMLLDFCDEPNMFFPGNKNACCGWSALEATGDPDNDLYLRYYACDAMRAQWVRDFKVNLPPKELPPYPRPWIPRWDPPIRP